MQAAGAPGAKDLSLHHWIRLTPAYELALALDEYFTGNFLEGTKKTNSFHEHVWILLSYFVQKKILKKNQAVQLQCSKKFKWGWTR